jgi:hypothetical protein
MAVWQRHPRYSLFIAVVLAATFYLLGHQSQTVPLASTGATLRGLTAHDLPSRLARSARIYNKLLVDRKKLIKKFGPTPKDIAL